MALKRRVLREIAFALLSAMLGLGAVRILELVVPSTRVAWPLGGLLSAVVRSWWNDSPGVWMLLGTLAAALSYPVRAWFALRRRDDAASTTAAELRILATFGAASSVVFASSAILRVHGAHIPTVSDALSRAVLLEHQMATWSTLGAGLSLLAVAWAVVGFSWARRESSRNTERIVASLGGVVLILLTGAALLRWWLTVASITYNAEWMMPASRYELIVSTGDPLVHGRWALIFVAASSAVVVLIAARRARSSPGASREMIVGAGLFALGLGAFALTRGAAYDALHPIPFWGDAADAWLYDDTIAALPPGETCIFGARDFPTLALSRDGRFRFNGSTWQEGAALQKTLESMKALWIQVQPGKSFPGRFEAVVPADTPIDVVARGFAVARAAGFDTFDLIEAPPRRSYVTRTLGVITYRPRVCHVLVEPSVELPRQGTWGDYARSLSGS